MRGVPFGKEDVEQMNQVESHYRHVPLLGLIVAAAFLIRFYAFTGFEGADDAHYLADAMELVDGDVTPNDSHWQARFGVTMPAALLRKLHAPTAIVLIGPQFFWSIASVVLIYSAGCLFFADRRVGLLAAALLAVYPLEVLYATCMFPETGIAFFTCAAFMAFAIGEERNRSILILFSGVLLGIAYIHRVTALYLLLPMALTLVVRRRFRPRSLLVFVGLAAFVGVECIAHAVVHGDALHRILLLVGRSQGSTDYATTPLRPGGPLFSPLVAVLTNHELGILYVVIPFAIAILCRKRDRPSYIVIAWFAALTIYTLWGTTSPFRYAQLRPWPRYLSASTIPGLLLTSQWVVGLANRRYQVILTSILVASSLGCIALDNGRTFPPFLNELKQAVLTAEGNPVAMSDRTYTLVFVANDLKPVPNVSIFEKSGEDSVYLSEKLDPNLQLGVNTEELSAGWAIVDVGRDVPATWILVGHIYRQPTWIYTLCSKLPGVLGKHARRSLRKLSTTVYRIPPDVSSD